MMDYRYHKYAFTHIFDRVCHDSEIEHRLTKVKHPYLPTDVRGIFMYLYMVIDVYSRKIVGWQIHENKSADLGDKFHMGFVIYQGKDIVPFGDKMFAIPMSSLWG